MTDDLSPTEQELARRLSGLGADPSPATRDSILRAVRTARETAVPRRPFQVRWRLPLAIAAAALLLVTGTVGVLAASSDALPSSPGYTLRYVGEGVRLATASPVGREELRIQFARKRFSQAQQVLRDNRSDAKRLVTDGSQYLDQAHRNLPSLSADEQGQVENQLNQAGQDEKAAQDQVSQEGQNQ